MAVELEDLALRLEDAGPRLDHHVGHHEDGRRHLAGDEPRVNELIEPVLVVAQGAFQPVGCEAQVGGPDGFVGLLRQLARGVAYRLGGQVALAVFGLDALAYAGHRLVGDAQAIGSHVGDQADRTAAVDIDSFVELLGDFHGLLARKAQADRRLLLERAGLEWGVGLVELFGLVDLGDDVRGRLQGVANGVGFGLGLGLELGTAVFGQRCPKPIGFGVVESTGLRIAAIFQYSSETNARISRSRSAINRTATD